MIETFTIGFWHPFGSHGGETADEIIARKRIEIAANGWTLWSFQFRSPDTFSTWNSEIDVVHPQAVFVFCSQGKGAIEPKSEITLCTHYRLANEETAWLPIPAAVKIPHHFNKHKQASAFIVKQILHPLGSPESCSVQWHTLHRRPWRSEAIPTRGEYLIRRGGNVNLRPYRAVLVLGGPYLAEVRAEVSQGY